VRALETQNWTLGYFFRALPLSTGSALKLCFQMNRVSLLGLRAFLHGTLANRQSPQHRE
jgi:hypothetical protein